VEEEKGVGEAYNFAAVFESEKIEISKQCGKRGVAEDLKLDEEAGSPVPDRLGIALSGGGIRSACVGLGIIQSLARARILRQVHYTSAISGGSYCMSFLTAWIKREQGLAQVEARLGNDTSDGKPAKTVAPPAYERFLEPNPLHYLRKYSSYLTPRVGLLSGDTLAFISIYLRNLLLNQILLLVTLMSSILLLQLIAPPLWWSDPINFCWIIVSVALVAILFAIGTRLMWASLKNLGKKSGKAGNSSAHVGVIALGVVICGLIWRITPSWYALGFSAYWTLAIVTVLAVVGIALSVAFGTLNDSVEKTRWVGGVALFLAWVVCGALVCGIDFAFRSWLIQKNAVVVGDEYVVLGFPLILLAVAGVSFAFIGILGDALPDSQREWLARLAGYFLFFAVALAALFGIVLEGPMLVHLMFRSFCQPGWLKHAVSAIIPGGWLFVVISGLLAGKSAQSSGDSGSPSKLDLLAAIAPPVFLAGLLLLVSWGTHALVMKTRAYPRVSDYLISADWNQTGQKSTSLIHLQPVTQHYYLSPKALEKSNTSDLPWGWKYFLFWFVTTGIAAILAWRLDVNEFSMHLFYRNRLVRAFLGASNASRSPSPFTGFAYDDDIALEDLTVAKGFDGPYPLWGTTLNITTGEDLAWQERKGASFIYSPLFCGWDYVDSKSNLPSTEQPGSDADEGARTRKPETTKYGYRSTPGDGKAPGYGGEGGKPFIGTAMAASGAAASPNMGYHTKASVAALLAIFNVRLGWWTGNPRNPNTWDRYAPGIWYLFAELMGKATDSDRYVYLSDGGHFENLGLYELVRRRVRFIICSDADADHAFTFEDLGGAIEKCRCDFGVEIKVHAQLEIAPADLVPYRKAHFAVGEIFYPGQPSTGLLLYLKSSLTNDEPPDVLGRRAADSAFPHDSTANQFFNESAFEAYRALGDHMMSIILDRAGLNKVQGTPRDRVHALYHNLRQSL
jgi:hypothetical protein